MPDHPTVRCSGSVSPAASLKSTSWACLLLALALPNAWAQSAGDEALKAQLSAMARLSPFLGTWLGEGWFTAGGKRVELIQGVTVTAELAGQVITTRDIILRRADSTPPRSATFGIWSYDAENRAYEFRSYFGSDHRDYAMEVPEPGLLIATGETPGGLGRLTMDGRDGIWRERAERSTDGGETWSTLYEITMQRQAVHGLAP